MPVPQPLDAELERLDPWSFWALPEGSFGVDRVLVGTTGVFVIATDATTDGRRTLRGARGLRAATRRVRSELSKRGFDLPVQAVLCHTGLPFIPFTRRRIRVVHRSYLVREIGSRSRAVNPKKAERALEALRLASR
jgi:hypothetical protein